MTNGPQVSELEAVNTAADRYARELEECREYIKIPLVREGYFSSWAQYSILLKDKMTRDSLQAWMKEKGIPAMIYYPKPMSRQTAFEGMDCIKVETSAACELCGRVLSLPMHPYITKEEQKTVAEAIKSFLQKGQSA